MATSTVIENDQIMHENTESSRFVPKETDEIDAKKRNQKAKKRRRRRRKKHRPESALDESAVNEDHNVTDEETSSVRNKIPGKVLDLSGFEIQKHEKQNQLPSEERDTLKAKQGIDATQLDTKHSITKKDKKSGQHINAHSLTVTSTTQSNAYTPSEQTSDKNNHTPSKSDVSEQQVVTKSPNASDKQNQNKHSHTRGEQNMSHKQSSNLPETPDRSHNMPKHRGREYRGKIPRHGHNNPGTTHTPNYLLKESARCQQLKYLEENKLDEDDTENSIIREIIIRENSPRKHSEHQRPANQTPASEKASPQGSHSSKKKKKHKKRKIYEEYWSEENVSAALKRGQIHQGNLRISSKNFEMAWVSLRDFKRDILIEGMVPRNRALDGDIVVLEILPKESWKVMAEEMRYHKDLLEESAEKLTNLQITSEEDGHADVEKNSGSAKSPTMRHQAIDIHEVPEQYLQRTAKIVYIIEKKHPRIACGYLRPMTDVNDPDGLFSPTDSRLPRFRIAHDDCPPGFFDRPQDFATTLMIARLTEWHRDAPLDSCLARGVFARSLGEAGEIEPETDSLLLINDIDSSPFSEEVLNCLPQDLPWKIPQGELESRRDFRDVCVFTIDPATARDLDDALHCNSLDDGTFEIGVHIADVSFFVKEGSALDEIASARATSTYMVQKVIPMLPRLLCEELCSLNPNEDRLTFSVVWKMDRNGLIQDEWMGKGIIRSRVKLSYEHAQEMIDHPDKEWSEEEHPPVANGTTIVDIAKRVRDLHLISAKLRRKRFENGTLRLDKAKISFDLDGKTGLPIGWHPYIQRESNKLIEEYMLLGNMAVAHRIYKAFPDRAMLRCHPKPDARQLEEVRALCNSLGINFMHGSSKGIQETLNTFPSNSPEHLVLSHLSMKPMKAAKYFCAATVEGDPEEFLHYALSVPLYTHFTSPIRRYPDVIVHRLLAACLEVQPAPAFSSENLDVIAGHCNDKKLAAKKAGEASVELYLGVFVRECGPLTEDGIVVNVMHESVDVLVPDFGIIKRVYFKFCDEVKSFEFQEGHKTRPAEVLITWKGPHDKRKTQQEQKAKTTSSKEDDHDRHRRADTLRIFTRVRVLLRTESDRAKNKGGLRFSGELLQNIEKE